ncbi:DHHC palmitoyltransferase [Ceratobasidium sp. AG-Ba]|nr:DHHC palmitoyltransferase [Ceratobasidium sp. AG-Ba]
MISVRVWQAMTVNGYFADPSTGELVFMILNYAACVPVILLVGGFSIYHFYCVASNQTTIEGWEKDKVATLIRRGKIRELKFPYHLGMWPNIRAILGERPWLWCWPQRMRGSGLSFPVAEGSDGRTVGPVPTRTWMRMVRVGVEAEHVSELWKRRVILYDKYCWVGFLRWACFSLYPDVQFVWPPKEPGFYKDRSLAASSALQTRLQGSPWTYGNEDLNPALRSRNPNSHPPYHPSYQPPQRDSNDPDRQFEHEYDDSSNSSLSRASSDYDQQESHGRDVRVRRGSEGWEVRPMTNEEIVARYARSRGIYGAEDEEVEPMELDGQEDGWDIDPPEQGEDFVEVAPARYNSYIPETPDSSEDEALATHVGSYGDD